MFYCWALSGAEGVGRGEMGGRRCVRVGGWLVGDAVEGWGRWAGRVEGGDEMAAGWGVEAIRYFRSMMGVVGGEIEGDESVERVG